MKTVRVAAASLVMALSMMLAAQAGSGLIPVAETSKDEIGGIAGPAGVAWTEIGRRAKIKVDDAVAPFTLTEGGISTFTGGMDGDEMIFQVVSGGGTASDIYLYDIPSRSPLPSPAGVNSKWWDYSPFKSGDWVLFARNNIGYGAKREWIKIMLVNTNTLEKRTLADVRPSWISPGQLTGNWAVWEKCGRKGCSVFRHDIGADTTQKIPQGAPAYYAPSTTADGTMYIARSKNACGGAKVVRRSPLGVEETILQLGKNLDIQEMYVWIDATLEHDLYITRIRCNTGEGDVVYIDSADTNPPIAPDVSAGAGDPGDAGPTERVDLMQGQPEVRRAGR